MANCSNFGGMRDHLRYGLLFSGLCFGLFFSACEETTGEPADLGLNYFPMDFGRYVTYKVDSIAFDEAIGDTFHFEIKERIDSTFIDGAGREAALVQRYYRDTEADPWVLKDIWTQTRTNQRAERLEEDVRYTRLAFPVNTAQEWDGNAFNITEEWEHSYEGVDIARTIGGQTFSPTVRVIQRQNSNLARVEEAEAIYARDIGMIYKRLDTFRTVFPSPVDPEIGIKLQMTAVDWGVE